MEPLSTLFHMLLAGASGPAHVDLSVGSLGFPQCMQLASLRTSNPRKGTRRKPQCLLCPNLRSDTPSQSFYSLDTSHQIQPTSSRTAHLLKGGRSKSLLMYFKTTAGYVIWTSSLSFHLTSISPTCLPGDALLVGRLPSWTLAARTRAHHLTMAIQISALGFEPWWSASQTWGSLRKWFPVMKPWLFPHHPAILGSCLFF